MALTNFYKGPEAEYSREKHINGIYMSTDSRKLWIFGQPTQELSDITNPPFAIASDIIEKADYDALESKDPNLIYIVKLSEE